MLKNAENIYVASGQKILDFKPDQEAKAELLKRATGRTSNLRAPALRIGKDLYIGFNQSMYNDLPV